MKILNRLTQLTAPTRQRIIEGKKKENFKKQCGCSNTSLNSMLMMMSTFTMMMGFACFMSNLINSIKQDSIKQAYPGSVRYQLNSLIGFGISLVILGCVQLYLQNKKKCQFYFISQVMMIPFAITMIALSWVFYSRVYHPMEQHFTEQECQNRVQRVFAKDQKIFDYYELVYSEFCSNNCPCKLNNQEYIDKMDKPIVQGNNETWETCSKQSQIAINESYNDLLSDLEFHYNCAGFCEVHQYYSFRDVGNSLPKRSCILSLTEEFNLIAETTVAINVISSILLLFFCILFLLIHKKIEYIWSYKLLKKQSLPVKSDGINNINNNNNTYYTNNNNNNNNQNSPIQRPLKSSSPNSVLKQYNIYDLNSNLTSSKKYQNNEVTRQDVCDYKDECERLERIIDQIKSKIKENEEEQQQQQLQQQQNSLQLQQQPTLTQERISTEQYYSSELEQALKMHSIAQKNYQNSIRLFQQQQKNSSETNSINSNSHNNIFESQNTNNTNSNKKQNIEQIINSIPPATIITAPSQPNLSEITQLQNISSIEQLDGLSPADIKLKAFPKTDLQVIEEEQRQFDSVS